MDQELSTDPVQTELSHALAASDIAYFEAGAVNTSCLGGVLSHVPGFPDSPLACVLHSLPGIEDLGTWLPELEACFIDRGARLVRFYLQHVDNKHRISLNSNGYRESIEIGFGTRLRDGSGGGLDLLRCETAQHWTEYTELNLVSGISPDGHDMTSDSYARISRLKVEVGYMVPYLAILDNRVLGFVNLAMSGQFARGKNLLVHPDHRGKGIGSAIIDALMLKAKASCATYFGIYAIAGTPSVALYKGRGMAEVTRQSEWSKSLVGD